MTAQEEFWNWFIRIEPELFDFDPSQVAERERIFDELATELQKVDPDLTFEFGPNEPTREFVISAGRIKRAFPAVVAPASAAPPLDRPQITAFHPRRTAPEIVGVGDKRVESEGIRFSLRHNGKIAGICLFIPGFRNRLPNA
jgi:hypothetical protein